MKTILLLLAIFLISSAHAAFHSTKVGQTIFEAVGKPAMIKIKGEAPVPTTIMKTENNKVSLESTLDLNLLKTGIDLRDEHMKEKYLETGKHPQAKLVITSLDLPANWEDSPIAIKDQPFKGTLHLHGKEAPVEGIFSLNEKREATSEFKIKLTDFGIEIPEYMGIKVAETVTIKTQIQLEKK